MFQTDFVRGLCKLFVQVWSCRSITHRSISHSSISHWQRCGWSMEHTPRICTIWQEPDATWLKIWIFQYCDLSLEDSYFIDFRGPSHQYKKYVQLYSGVEFIWCPTLMQNSPDCKINIAYDGLSTESVVPEALPLCLVLLFELWLQPYSNVLWGMEGYWSSTVLLCEAWLVVPYSFVVRYMTWCPTLQYSWMQYDFPIAKWSTSSPQQSSK